MIVEEDALAGATAIAGENRLEVLKQQINDENYLDAAISRLALVLSKELMYINSASINKMREGGLYGKRRK